MAHRTGSKKTGCCLFSSLKFILGLMVFLFIVGTVFGGNDKSKSNKSTETTTKQIQTSVSSSSDETTAEDSVIKTSESSSKPAKTSTSTSQTVASPIPLEASETTASLTETPVSTPTPTKIPVTPAPTKILVTPAPTKTPVTPAPTSTPPPGPAVIITKNPTSETLSAGGQTWFIAHAQNANSVTWEVIDPNGKVYTTTEAMAKNPGLSLSVLADQDTISVSNVPASFNGWSVQARYDGQGNSATTSKAYIYVNAPTSSYSSSGSSSSQSAEQRISAPAKSGSNYVLNTNTGKFHHPWCSSVNQMKASNRWDFYGTREEVIAKGYVPCKKCNP